MHRSRLVHAMACVFRSTHVSKQICMRDCNRCRPYMLAIMITLEHAYVTCDDQSSKLSAIDGCMESLHAYAQLLEAWYRYIKKRNEMLLDKKQPTNSKQQRSQLVYGDGMTQTNTHDTATDDSHPVHLHPPPSTVSSPAPPPHRYAVVTMCVCVP